MSVQSTESSWGMKYAASQTLNHAYSFILLRRKSRDIQILVMTRLSMNPYSHKNYL